MKIVLVGAGMIPIPPPDYGAVEKHIWNLAKQLEARGHEVRIVNKVFGTSSKDEYRFALWARKEVRREPYDVLHLHTPGVAAVFSAFGPREYVFTTHSRHWAGAEGLGPKIGFHLERRAVAHAKEAIAVSKFVAAQVERPMHVIPNGVDVNAYAPLTAERTGLRIVGLGEVAAHKRWHLAAAAIAAIPEKGATLDIVGPIRDPAYATQVEEAGGGRARVVGVLSERELAARLGAADVMVHPSVSESFGMAVVEGMSCGLPVICSDFLSFLVTHGEEGLLIPTNADDAKRIEAIRQALVRVLGDDSLRASMGARARERAVSDYSWESVAHRVESVYARFMA